MDWMKILGGLMASGALSRGSGSDILGSILGSLAGGGQAAGRPSGGGMGDVLGGMLGGGTSRAAPGGSAGGGLGDLLGGLLGGAMGSGSSSSGGGLADLIGAAMKQMGGSRGGFGLADFEPEAEPEQANDQAMVLVYAMINAAKADGRVDEEERQKIVAGLGEEVSPEEARFVEEALAEPLDVEAFVQCVPKGMEQVVYLMSLTAIDLDTNPEARYLQQLAQGLGLDAGTVNAIHEQAGVPPLQG